jgi:hypothetical protein
MFKFSMIVPFALVVLLLTTARADATIILLAAPQIDFGSDAEKKLKEAIEAVIEDKHYQLLGGGWTMGWGLEHDCSNLLYSGDTKALAEFIVALKKTEGLKVKITPVSSISSSLILDTPEDLAVEFFQGKGKPKPVPSWKLRHYKQKSDSVEVLINTSSKDVSIDNLLEELAQRAANAAKSKP